MKSYNSICESWKSWKTQNPLENHKKNENHIISLENNENHEHRWIRNENHENHENQINPFENNKKTLDTNEKIYLSLPIMLLFPSLNIKHYYSWIMLSL